MFQVRRDKWPTFQTLFEAVTGFKVEEDVAMLDGKPLTQSSDRRTQRAIEQFVQSFRLIKPREVITQRQCSAGERKIAKALSTVINQPVMPDIILIDNVTDHVELARHLPVMAAIEKCFSKSQIIATCHSAPVQRHLPDRDRLIDLRFLHCDPQVRQEPWRLRLFDEVSDSLDKINSLAESDKRRVAAHNAGLLLKILCEKPATPPADGSSLVDMVQRHLTDVNDLAVADSVTTSREPRIKVVEIEEEETTADTPTAAPAV